MQKKFTVDLSNIDNLEGFVREIIEVKSDVNASYKNQMVDAKSLMGVIMVSAHPVKVEIISDDEEEIKVFEEICKKYEVK